MQSQSLKEVIQPQRKKKKKQALNTFTGLSHMQTIIIKEKY